MLPAAGLGKPAMPSLLPRKAVLLCRTRLRAAQVAKSASGCAWHVTLLLVLVCVSADDDDDDVLQ